MIKQILSYSLLVIILTSCSNYITKTGKASFYSDKYKGKKTANGETYKPNEFTAAHKKLPFGTKVKVTNLNNNKTVTVRINDRGPFVAGRIIDLSRVAASEIGMINNGVVKVKIKYKRNKD
ncbi:MAG TPA: septal ring lytic transglycosylase RlpA family protein [Chitinophagaceae bacterium]|nr:septal ring lytic transglycosylase RlpA family protein [Chitinophagaceae bacterium]MCC6634198.1 septal ring lytic transglycosylase RlpA family protein [Chitinophagaceae bacterium]HMZ46347.1 septal ring lytic transglycosylase RlpA family protein [Chitinophagaceae bacterium]HNE93829.1 septal ring lytic transglycosylase RlpA family protein [Chitinophagaceae bacterium]HNF28684.1 septal ring lytic transglycosylase RlpA family protein [Chitinophagaceae bacterium]